MSRRLVLLRHGQTTANATGVWQGQLDTALSAVGEAQALVAARELARVEASHLISSDLQRAARTADAVAAVTGLDVHSDARFREIHAGEWQGLTNAEVVRDYPREREAVLRGEDIKRGVTGESLSDLRSRVGGALDDVQARLGEEECAIVVSHGAAIRAMAAYLLQVEDSVAGRILGVLDNCHWAHMEQGRRGWRLLGWNVGALAAAPDGESSPP